MIVLAAPWWLGLLPLPVILWRVLPAWGAPVTGLRLPFLPMLAEALGRRPVRGAAVARRTVPGWVAMGLIWCALVVGLADPRLLGAPQEKLTATRDLMLSIDLSASMDKVDFEGPDGAMQSRLTGVKGVVSQFLDARDGDRVGMIVYGDRAFIQAPFTEDLSAVEELLAATQAGMAGPKTALGDSLGLAIRAFETSRMEKKVVILLTDGADTGSRMAPLPAARIASDAGIVVHTIGVGDPDGTGEDRVDFDTLQQIAEITGGRFFEASDTDALEEVYAEIDALTPVEQAREVYRPEQPVPFWPALAVLLVAFAFLALPHRRWAP
ncbi:VWA domain-containing protein [Oceanomicrobium pacificus]|uniref:VWA domain-containing protein n=1 Tax=Oceanomicrobium pacificus TaxID=2692916 RepID=A0A6B0TRE1_9RHOB|nr:VWA domain-containing protein [Oceanomicrobium pacificus]MXU65269.1 VWA domain-containing protein [Oceanomicrobium pacificus]